MKRSLIIIIIAVAVLALVAGAFWLGARSSKNGNTNSTADIDSQAANINSEALKVTYEPYSGELSGYTFDTVKEWTSVAPSEVRKSITEEQLNGYEIVYYSSNAQAVALSVTGKSAANQTLTMAAIVENDQAAAQKGNSGMKIVDQRVTELEARLEATLKSGQTDYTVYSRYLLLPQKANDTRWVLEEVSVPSSRTAQYKEIVAHLFDSLRLASEPSGTNLPE